MSDTLLILHVKGTEQETTSLPRQVVRTAISQGRITHSQLIWSPADNAWKQVREMPQLLPSQKLAPAPERIPTTPLPQVANAPRPQTGTVPRVVSSGSLPKIAADQRKTVAVPRVAGKATAAKPVAQPVVKADRGQSTGSLEVKEQHVSHPLKWVCIGLGALIGFALVVNYFLVSWPLKSRLSQTPYANVSAYAHLGAFLQPNVIVIHVPQSSSLNEENLTSFLAALAQSTPNMPLSHNPYERVALTSGWAGTYTMTGYAWKELGDMGNDDEAQRKEFLLDSLANAAGEPLMPSDSSLNEEALQVRREAVWKSFAAQFVKP